MYMYKFTQVRSYTLNKLSFVSRIMNRSHFLCWWLFISYCVEGQDPAVTLRQGRVVGTRIFTSGSTFPIETFFGIPYASAPIGRHRFSAPERHPGWQRTLYARRLQPRCPQLEDGDFDGYFNEDCLFLNICTPRRAEVNLLPVVILLYSSSWSHKSPSTLPCQELAAEGLVVVTLSYRLHLLGFFSLRSRQARGNMALLDQYMALTWTRENINEFGGNPDLITLLGHSAGADSILYHLASPRTAGLFQRAIIMSPRDIWRAVGSEVNSGADSVERSSRQAAQSLNCAGDDEAIVRCMQSRPLDDIIKLYAQNNWTMEMGPVIEDFLQPSEQYLPMDLYRALTSADNKPPPIDVLFGTTDLDTINSNDVIYKELLSRGSSAVLEYATLKVLPDLLQLQGLHDSPAMPALLEAIQWEYFGAQPLRADQNAFHILEAMCRAETSARVGAGAALLAARLARRVSRLFMYRYSQPGHVDLLGRPLNYTGAVHGTDLIALLGDGMLQQLARRRPAPAEQSASEYLRKYFVHFIKFGSPTPNELWPAYRAGAAYLHDIHNENRESDMRRAGRDVAFWLQYLPYINSLISPNHKTEPLNLGQDETRLRGAVYALVCLAIGLLVLLGIGAALLKRQRRRQDSDLDD